MNGALISEQNKRSSSSFFIIFLSIDPLSIPQKKVANSQKSRHLCRLNDLFLESHAQTEVKARVSRKYGCAIGGRNITELREVHRHVSIHADILRDRPGKT